jgi:O-antigen ligase
VLSTGAGFAITGTGSESQPLVLLLWLLAYAVGAVMLVDAVARLRQLPLPSPWVLLFVALALASTAWSETPSVTLRRSVALLGTVIASLAIADRLRPVEVLEAVRRATVLIASSSVLLYVVGDERALDDVHQTLRGVVSTKNSLGSVMAVGLIACACIWYLDSRRWRRCVIAAVPMVIALSLTDSVGGTVVALAGVAAIGAIAMWRGRRSRKVLGALLFGVIGAVIMAVPAGLSARDAAELSGRDATLTGRTDIWEESQRAALERPFGHGFGAFWGQGGGGVASVAATRISARLNQSVETAHNGVLDVALVVGLPGAALAVLLLLSVVAKGLSEARAGLRDSACLRMVLAGLVIVATITESGLFQENSLLTVLIVIAAARRIGDRRDDQTRTGAVGAGTRPHDGCRPGEAIAVRWQD